MKNMTNWFIWTSRFEGLSFIMLLFMAMPLKYMMDMPIWVKVIGPIHGVLFILYIILLLMIRENLKLSMRDQIMGVIASIVPLGPFWFEKKIQALIE